MTDGDYPHTFYGVELRTKDGWVLLDGIQKSRDEAEHVAAILIDCPVPDPDDLRVVALTISRKGDPE